MAEDRKRSKVGTKMELHNGEIVNQSKRWTAITFIKQIWLLLSCSVLTGFMWFDLVRSGSNWFDLVLYIRVDLVLSFDSINTTEMSEHNSSDSNISGDESTDSNGSGWGGQDDVCCYPGGYEVIIVPVIFCIVVAFGCLGNMLVMLVVIKNREQYTNTTNLFILNLAIADVFFLVFCVPFHAIIYIYEWPFGEFLCKFVHLVQYSGMVTSIFTLVAMSLDRFMAVGYPIHTKHLRTPRSALVISLTIWAASLIIASPWCIVYTVRVYDIPGYTPYTICADDWGSARKRAIYYLVLFIAAYAFPVILISIFSGLTVSRLWGTETMDGPGHRRSLDAKRRVTRLISVVVLVFAVCWLPMHVIWLWTNYFPDSWENAYSFYYARIAAHVLSYANSCMNPIIYAFLSSRFRRGFTKALRCHLGSTAGPTSIGNGAGGDGGSAMDPRPTL